MDFLTKFVIGIGFLIVGAIVAHFVVGVGVILILAGGLIQANAMYCAYQARVDLDRKFKERQTAVQDTIHAMSGDDVEHWAKAELKAQKRRSQTH